MPQETPEILSSQIVDIDPENNCIKTEDGEVFRLSEVSIISESVTVLEIPYAGCEMPTVINRHTTNPYRANLIA